MATKIEVKLKRDKIKIYIFNLNFHNLDMFSIYLSMCFKFTKKYLSKITYSVHTLIFISILCVYSILRTNANMCGLIPGSRHLA